MRYDPFDLWNPHSAIHHVKEQKVTNPEPNVSEKARELAALILYPQPKSVNFAAGLIQAYLSELLEAGRAACLRLECTCVPHDPTPCRNCKVSDHLAAILSKWEPR